MDVNCLVFTYMDGCAYPKRHTPHTHTNSDCPPNESLVHLDWRREEEEEEEDCKLCHSKGGRLVLVKERIHCTACHKTHSAGTGKREEVEGEVEDEWKEKGDEDVQDTEGWWYTQGLVDAQLDGSRRQKAWLVGKVAATVDREGRTT